MGGLDVVIVKAVIGSCSCLAAFGLFIFWTAGFVALVLTFVRR